MAYEMRDGGGTIFKNKYKESGDNKPDYKGDVMWRGEKIEVALWVKDGANGKFFSVKLQEPREKVPAPKRDPRDNSDMDDEIPF